MTARYDYLKQLLNDGKISDKQLKELSDLMKKKALDEKEKSR